MLSHIATNVRAIKQLLTLLREEKYNLGHDDAGRFTTSEHISEDHSDKTSPLLQKLRPPQKILDEYEMKSKAVFAIKANRMDMTVEEYTKALDQKAQDLLKNAQPWMRVRPEIFETILQDTRFKSQFETNTSGGALSPKHRVTAEENLFGYAADSTAPEERPLYGYASDHPDGTLESTDRQGDTYDKVGMYGSVSISR